MGLNILTTRQRQTLRKARERAGLTQLQLADRLGIVREYVTMIESGKKAASLDVLQRLGEALGLEITVETVVTIKRKRKPKKPKGTA